MTFSPPDPQGPELEHRGTVRCGAPRSAQELEEGKRMLRVMNSKHRYGWRDDGKYGLIDRGREPKGSV